MNKECSYYFANVSTELELLQLTAEEMAALYARREGPDLIDLGSVKALKRRGALIRVERTGPPCVDADALHVSEELIARVTGRKFLYARPGVRRE